MDTAVFVPLYTLVGLILVSAVIGSWFALILTGTKVRLFGGIVLVLALSFAVTAVGIIPSTYLGVDKVVGFILTYGVYVFSMIVTVVIVARRRRAAERIALTQTPEFWQKLLDEENLQGLLSDNKPK